MLSGAGHSYAEECSSSLWKFFCPAISRSALYNGEKITEILLQFKHLSPDLRRVRKYLWKSKMKKGKFRKICLPLATCFEGEPKANAHGANPELMERLRCLALQRNFSREYRGVLKIESITLYGDPQRKAIPDCQAIESASIVDWQLTLAAAYWLLALAACTGCLHWLLTLAAYIWSYTGCLH